MRSDFYARPGKLLFPAFFFLQSLISILILPGVAIAQAPCTGPSPVLVLNAPPAPVCSPTTINLRNQVNSSSTLPSGTVLSYLDNSLNPVSDPSAVSQSGTYYIKATTPGGCTDQQQVIVIINQTPTIFPLAGGPFCSNYNFTYLLSGQNITSWDGPGVVISSGSYFFKPSSAGPGTHTLIATNSTGGCQASTQVVVNQAPNLVLTTSTPPATCSPGTVNLTSLVNAAASNLPAGTLIYYYDATSTPVPDPSAVSQSGTYRIVASVSTGAFSDCSDSKQVTVTVNQSPTIFPLAGGPFCSNYNFTYLLSGQNITSWSGPGVVISSGSYFF